MTGISRIKQGFFNQSLRYKNPVFTFKRDFNLQFLTFEFSSLYALFRANQRVMMRHPEIVTYLYYLSQVLTEYYSADYVANTFDSVDIKQKKLAAWLAGKAAIEETEQTLQQQGRVRARFRWASQVGKTVRSSALLRGYLARLIASRSQWNASRALGNHLIRFAVHSGLAEEMRKWNDTLGIHCGVPEFLQALDKTQGLLRISGVALNGLRFLINLSTLIKHLVMAVKDERLSVKTVFLQEMEKRVYTLTDDLMWGSGNLLNNYHQICHLSASSAAGINLLFLGMDAVMFLVSWLIEMKNYRKTAQALQLQQQENPGPLQSALIGRQLDRLQDGWRVTCTYYVFNIAAALLMVVVFAVTLTAPAPFLAACLALCSMIGNAMYNSVNEFKQYQQLAMAVRREQANRDVGMAASKHTPGLLAARDRALSLFVDTLLVNTGLTASLIAVAAVSLPLAGVLVMCYLGYRLQHGRAEKGEFEENSWVYRLAVTP